MNARARAVRETGRKHRDTAAIGSTADAAKLKFLLLSRHVRREISNPKPL
jgi:hypothetical protein